MKLEVTGQNTWGGVLYTQNTAEFYRVSSSSVQLSTDHHIACEGTPLNQGKKHAQGLEGTILRAHLGQGIVLNTNSQS